MCGDRYKAKGSEDVDRFHPETSLKLGEFVMQHSGGILGSGWEPGDFSDREETNHGPRAQSPHRSRTVRGVVRDFRERADQIAGPNEYVGTFRVERHDPERGALSPVCIEVRGRSFRGSIVEGDWVEVPGRWQEGKVLHPRRVRNLTTGEQVLIRGTPPFLVLMTVLIFSALAIATVFVLTSLCIQLARDLHSLSWR
jgi:hypothetical protein